jgi:hypothetical protein
MREIDVMKRGNEIAVLCKVRGHTHIWYGKFGELHSVIKSITETAWDPELDFSVLDAAEVCEVFRREWMDYLPMLEPHELWWLDDLSAAIAKLLFFIKRKKQNG